MADSLLLLAKAIWNNWGDFSVLEQSMPTAVSRKSWEQLVQWLGGWFPKETDRRKPPSQTKLLEKLGPHAWIRLLAHRMNKGKFNLPTLAMQPCPWPVPEIPTIGDLAAWCGLSVGHLFWLSDAKGLEARVPSDAEKLRNYRYTLLQKPNGTVRLVEAPKARLKALQRRLLHELLQHIPVHPAAHGFVPGRDVRSFATPHVGQQVVIRFDLENFFPSIRRGRISAIFRHAGYPPGVERCLASLVPNLAPPHLLPSRALRDCYYVPHLPQGAPTSPWLANLAAYKLDARLSGLARACGGVYTRYADDLAFSGGAEMARSADRFVATVYRIILEEGFQPNFRKTKVMRPATRQTLAGVVVNEKLNLTRKDFDQLKAILHDAIRHGPAKANRQGQADFRAHLQGKISWWQQIHPGRGEKLRKLFEAVVWSVD